MSVNSYPPSSFESAFSGLQQGGSAISDGLMFTSQSEPSKMNLDKYVEMVESEDKANQIEGLVAIRKLLSLKDNPPIQEVIDSGVVPKMLEFMKPENEEKFQFESAWAITNICSGTSQHVEFIVSLGGLDIIIRLLNSNSIDVLDQAVWALGNIAGDNPSYRDLCLMKGLMEKLVAALAKFPHNPSLKRNGIWALSNLVRGKPIPAWSQISLAASVFRHVIAESVYDEALIDALWGISWTSETYIQQVIDLGCLPYLVQHLKNDNITVLMPTLRALGNIVTGDDTQTTMVLVCSGFLPRIFELTSNSVKKVRKEACWLISNITAGTPSQISMILEQPHYLGSLKKVLFEDSVDVATEAAWALGNIASGATLEQITQMMDKYEYGKCLERMLGSPNPKVLQIGLEATRNVLNVGEGANVNNFREELVKLDVVAKLNVLLEHKNINIADLAEEILEVMEELDGEKKVEKEDKGDGEEEDDEEEEEDEEDEEDEESDKEEKEIKDDDGNAYQDLERED